MRLWNWITGSGKKELYYYDTKSEFAVSDFADHLNEMIWEKLCREEKSGVVLLCIGTDRSTGDSLGPLIGYKLKARKIKHLDVIGTLEWPVHAMNLDAYMTTLQNQYPNHLVIAVDASVGNMEHIGYITLGNGALKPGLGVCKELREVGDICITGIVGGCKNYDPLMLQSIRLATVMQLADCITESICLVEKLLEKRVLI